MKLDSRTSISSLALVLAATVSVSAQSASDSSAATKASVSTITSAPEALPATRAPVIVAEKARPAVVPLPVPRPVALLRRREVAPTQLQEARLRPIPSPERVAVMERPAPRAFPIIVGVGY